MNQPCSLTNYLEPNEVNWNITLPKNLSYVAYKGWDFTNHFYNIVGKDKDKDVIVLNMYIDYLLTINQHPVFQSKLEILGYKDHFESKYLFAKWYRKLFKFNKNLKIDYQKYLKQLRPNFNHKIICVQVRIGGKRSDPGKNDYLFMHRNETNKYWKFIKEKFIFNEASNKTLRDYRIFLTTDTFDVIEEANQVFGNDKIVSSNSKIANIAHYRVNRNSNIRCSDFNSVFIDFFLLSQCDMGLVSHSGFGRYGVLNRENNNYDNFYSYSRTSPSNNSFRFFEKFEDYLKKRKPNDLRSWF